MSQAHLTHQIMAALLCHLAQPNDRHFERLYKLINQHPQLNRNQRNRYRREFFEEALQEAWLIFYRKNLQVLLNKLEDQGMAIAPENAAAIVIRIIKHLNELIRNKNVDLWRKETFPKAP